MFTRRDWLLSCNEFGPRLKFGDRLLAECWSRRVGSFLSLTQNGSYRLQYSNMNNAERISKSPHIRVEWAFENPRRAVSDLLLNRWTGYLGCCGETTSVYGTCGETIWYKCCNTSQTHKREFPSGQLMISVTSFRFPYHSSLARYHHHEKMRFWESCSTDTISVLNPLRIDTPTAIRLFTTLNALFLKFAIRVFPVALKNASSRPSITQTS